jgi:hypothetical protein
MISIKLAVVGSRSITDKSKIYEYLDYYMDQAEQQGKTLILVSGGAKGVDTTAAEFAQSRGLILINVLPAWHDRHGNFIRSAGFKRNDIIWEIADCGIAFWDRVSKGTAHSFKLAKAAGKKIAIIEIDDLPF